jgi:cell division protein FtsI (penicillin-binding protein 3)
MAEPPRGTTPLRRPTSASSPVGPWTAVETGADAALARWLRFRAGVVFGCLVFFFGLATARLVQLQVLPDDTLEALADRQYRMTARTANYRRPILDRNGEELAVSVPSSSLYARPKLVRGKKFTARVLARSLGGSAEKWLAKLSTERPFVWLQRHLSPEQIERLAKYRLPGLFLESEMRRVYPNGTVAGPLLGFVGVDGNGLAGLEFALDDVLLDRSSRVPMSRDGRGVPTYIARQFATTRAIDAGVRTTIDRRLQNAVEEELDATMAQSDARAAFAVVMDPHSGEVLALGQRPTFDPNEPTATPAELRGNALTGRLYEPGSVVKPLFVAAAIEEGLVTPETMLDGANGRLAVGGVVFREAEAGHAFRQLTVADMLKFSSNIGAIRIVELLGPRRVADVLDRFGFTQRTGIELPGEASAPAKPENFWRNPVQLAAAGFGHGFFATPLQMVASYAPLANGGYLVAPRVLYDESWTAESVRKRRVLSERSAETMRKMLAGVVADRKGTGHAAWLDGVSVAGKTGTAQKYDGVKGYASGRYFSSFIGFLPAERPELLIGVMVDEPQGAYYAGKVAAPLFRRIASRGLPILGRVPKVAVVRATQRSEGAAAIVSEPPAPAAPTGEMPDLRGLSVRDALRAIAGQASVDVRGSGFLFEQSPPPGAPLVAGSRVALRFSPSVVVR